MENNGSKDKLLAVLIDADNISHRHVENLLLEITRYGTPTIKRIYGDWTKSELGGWKNSLVENSLTPIQQYGYASGKNSTDSAMIIDAMDILYSDAVDGFCLVSSDSDFTRLAVRLREAGKVVYGIGEKKTPVSFIAACTKFIYIEILERDDDEDSEGKSKSEEKKERKQSIDRALKNMIKSTVSELSDDDGWTNLAALGTSISRKRPDFDSRNYGYIRLSVMLRAMKMFEFEERTIGSSRNKHIYIKNKEGRASAAKSKNAKSRST